MHTTQLGNGPDAQAHHNGDFSGDVWFTGDSVVFDLEVTDRPLGGQDIKVVIPFEWLEHLVAKKKRSEIIEWAEIVDDEDILYKSRRF